MTVTLAVTLAVVASTFRKCGWRNINDVFPTCIGATNSPMGIRYLMLSKRLLVYFPETVSVWVFLAYPKARRRALWIQAKTTVNSSRFLTLWDFPFLHGSLVGYATRVGPLAPSSTPNSCWFPHSLQHNSRDGSFRLLGLSEFVTADSGERLSGMFPPSSFSTPFLHRGSRVCRRVFNLLAASTRGWCSVVYSTQARVSLGWNKRSDCHI